MKNTKKKSWLKKAKIPLYGGSIWVGVGDSVRDVCIDHRIAGADPERLAAGCFRDNEGRFALIFERKSLTHPIIAHECVHASFRISEYFSWRHTNDTVEPFAVLHEWITNFVYKALKKNNEVIIDK